MHPPPAERPAATHQRTPDRALIEQLLADDEHAYRELLARYRSMVYAIAYAVLVDPERAEAAVVQTFREARRTAEGLHYRGLGALGVDQHRVGDRVHHAAVAGQQLTIGVLVVSEELLDEGPIRRALMCRSRALCGRAHMLKSAGAGRT